MRLFAILLMLATMMGVVSSSHGDGHGDLGASSAQTVSVFQSAPPVVPSSADCDCEGCLSHTCHLGHCAFVVLDSHPRLAVSGMIYVFPANLVAPSTVAARNLFRPPIAA